MRLVTWNLNGIRAAIRKGLDEFVERINPDILLLDEPTNNLDLGTISWLENILKKESDLIIIVSSIQVLPTNHVFEKWHNFPH